MKVREVRLGVDRVSARELELNVTTTTAYHFPDRAAVTNLCTVFRDHNGAAKVAPLGSVLIVGSLSYGKTDRGWFRFEIRNFSTSYTEVAGSTGGPSHQMCTSAKDFLQHVGDGELGPMTSCGTERCRTIAATFETRDHLAGFVTYTASRKLTFLVSEQTGRIVRRALETTWSDGRTLTETADFYDYGVPNLIEAPPGS